MEKNLKYLKHLESIDKSLKGIMKEMKKTAAPTGLMSTGVSSSDVPMGPLETRKAILDSMMNDKRVWSDGESR